LTDKLRELIYGRLATCNHGDTWARRIGELAGTGLSFAPAGGGGWTKFVRGALDAAETAGELIEVSKSALRLANGEGDLDDLVTLGITGAGLGAGGLPPGKGKGKGGDPNVPSGLGGDITNPDNPWNFKPEVDLDLRGTGKNIRNALDEAFKRTGVPKEQFTPTKWGRDANGKSFPAEYRVLSGPNKGAEVNVDVGHTTSNKGPLVPHVGYQGPGKRNAGGTKRGHILIDDVPYNR